MLQENEIYKMVDHNYYMKISNLTLLREGGCISYSVISRDKTYFLKIIPPAFKDTAKQSLGILRYLEEKDFPAPRVVLTKDGSPYLEVEEPDFKVLLVLFQNIEGQEPEEGQDIEYIGELIGKLHLTMREFKGSLPELSKDYFIDRYIRILKKMNYDKNKIELFREHGETLWKRVEKLPRGFNHGDMHRGNLLKTASGKIYLLDFDTSNISFPIYDIMIMCNATNYFDFEDSGYEKAKSTYETFLRGYTKYGTLSDKELEAFYDLIAIYHYQLQATIIEIYGLDCVDTEFLDKQLDWLMRWERQCKEKKSLYSKQQ